MKPDMKPAFENDGPPSAMAQQENNYSPHSDGRIPAANLDAEKGLETPPQQEEKEAQVRQITGFKVSAESSSDLQSLTLLDSGSCSSPAP